MKKCFFYLLLLIPGLLIAQNKSEYGIFENGMITANPTKVKQFEAGLAAHNKKYHADNVYGARVYWITSGKNVGKYIWAMGPTPWSAFDNRPIKKGHEEDWNNNVLPYTLSDGDQTYWKFHPKLSNFPKDFTLKKLLIDTYDIKRFQGEKMMALMEKIKKVMVSKYPNDSYGMYTNELPDMNDGRDLAFVSFFEKSGWMGRENNFPKYYDEVHGAGSFKTFIKDWSEVSIGKSSSEIWIYREDLSGLNGQIKSVSRQK